MNSINNLKHKKWLITLSFLSLSACLAITNVTTAQQDSKATDKPASTETSTTSAIAPEHILAVWKLQAKDVATALHLSAESSAKLTDVYVAARKQHQSDAKKLNAEESDRAARKKASFDLDQKQRGMLVKKLEAILTAEQSKTAIKSLGTFSTRWDQYVDQLTKFNLDEEKSAAASKLVTKYIADHGTAVSEARKDGGRLSRDTSNQLKETLDKALAKLLSEEQIAIWNSATAFGGKGETSTAKEKTPVDEKVPGTRKPANRGK